MMRWVLPILLVGSVVMLSGCTIVINRRGDDRACHVRSPHSLLTHGNTILIHVGKLAPPPGAAK